jgi:GH25 family lysozyme M1 (1,4-beta-N-acetylmuramidase)
MDRLVLDASNNRPVSEQQLRASGAVALYAKATEGGTFEDRTLHEHRRAAERVGVPFGSYLFLHPNSPGNEAALYLRYARPRRGDLAPAIDAEVLDGGSFLAEAQRVHRCARELERHGFEPILYASSSFWLGMFAAYPALRRLRVWEADYPGRFTRWSPGLAARRIRLRHGATVVMWQWTDRYAVQGQGFDASVLTTRLASLRIR